jgi:hypothetical protein
MTQKDAQFGAKANYGAFGPAWRAAGAGARGGPRTSRRRGRPGPRRAGSGAANARMRPFEERSQKES